MSGLIFPIHKLYYLIRSHSDRLKTITDSKKNAICLQFHGVCYADEHVMFLSCFLLALITAIRHRRLASGFFEYLGIVTIIIDAAGGKSLGNGQILIVQPGFDLLDLAGHEIGMRRQSRVLLEQPGEMSLAETCRPGHGNDIQSLHAVPGDVGHGLHDFTFASIHPPVGQHGCDGGRFFILAFQRKKRNILDDCIYFRAGHRITGGDFLERNPGVVQLNCFPLACLLKSLLKAQTNQGWIGKQIERG